MCIDEQLWHLFTPQMGFGYTRLSINIVHGKILTFLAPNLVMYQIYVENIEKVIHVEML